MTDATRREWLAVLSSVTVAGTVETRRWTHNPTYRMKQFERGVRR